MKRKTFLLLLLLLLLPAGCAGQEKERAADLLAEQEAALTALADTILRTGSVPGSASLPGVERIDFYPPGTVEFILGSRGLVPSSAYWGLHYSPDGNPRTFQGTAMDLEPDGAGWSWEGPGGPQYRTEPLGEHWFYFEMHF